MRRKTNQTSHRRTGCLTWLLSCAFLAIGFGIFWYLSLSPWLQLEAAKEGWIETDCVVRKIEVKAHHNQKGATYSPDVLYEYTYGGQPYTSDQFWFGNGSYGDRNAVAKAVADYQPGGEYRCYVNPSQPQEAVLSLRLAAHWWLGCLFGAIFGGVGFVALCINLRNALKWRTQPTATNVGGKLSRLTLPRRMLESLDLLRPSLCKRVVLR